MRSGVSPESTSTSPVVRCERGAGGAHRVAGAERLLLHDDGDVVPRELVAPGGRRDDDERLGAGRAAGLDHPVDHAAAEDRVEVLRHRGAHAGAEASGHHDGCDAACLSSGVSDGWLGRQDSNLGSRDQNPLPYRLATPHVRRRV